MEINGFGVTEQRGRNVVVVDAFVTRQIARSDGVIADGEGILRACAERGVKLEQLRCQWHSHVRYKAEFSVTDIAQINRYSGGYMVSVVANKRGEVSCRLDCYEPLRMAFAVPLEAFVDSDDALIADCALDIKREVTIIGTKKKERRK